MIFAASLPCRPNTSRSKFFEFRIIQLFFRGSLRVFLDTLEPYVLTGKLKMLSPELLGAFVDRCQVSRSRVCCVRAIHGLSLLYDGAATQTYPCFSTLSTSSYAYASRLCTCIFIAQS